MDSLKAQLHGVDWDLVSSYGGLLSLATFSIYAGSYGSLPVCLFPSIATLVCGGRDASEESTY